MGSIRIAVDIGGTFTDGIASEQETNLIWVAKSLTTPDDPGEAVSIVIDQLLNQVAQQSSTTVEEVVHGTTLVTNALIERKGSPTAAILTKGFKDVFDIRRELRYDLYDLTFRLPPPLIPEERRFDITERISVEGEILHEIDDGELDRLLECIDASGAASVAVCLLHSYRNDTHERQIGAFLKRERPDLMISLSSAVAREMREYERASTTAANAYVKPLVSTYLSELERRLDDLKIGAPLRIMLSSGGFTSSQAAAETPIALLESGPAGGVISALNTGLAAGEDNILAFDMGGTTAKAGLVQNGKPSTTRTFEAGRVHRFKKGSGLPLLITSIELIEIGAGGGSLASVSNLGLLNVGPESAGSVPGPVCYGLGGTQATVTDADLWLGYLDAEHFLGGTMRLDLDATGRALEDIGTRLGLTANDVAFGIHNIVNENMAGAARIHIAEKGHDPRDFTLVATGGAGPVHAVEIARKLGIRRVLCASAAGAGSCLGFLAAPVRIDRTLTQTDAIESLDWDGLIADLQKLAHDARTELQGAGANIDTVNYEVDVEMRYRGQGNTVSVSVPFGSLGSGFAQPLITQFEVEYEKLFGQKVPDGTPEAIAWRLVVHEHLVERRFVRADRQNVDADDSPVRRRKLYQPILKDFVECGVYERARLLPGVHLQAPLVIEEAESTLVVPVPASVSVRDDYSILVELSS
ncbi:hydantoinase/oxoprolinase family protein [Pelagibacterium lacus]|uniref:Hydantoinase/oxoprolinase family protein n=1 Tax=Pelagibacterium lacus TaxID=2282655 RepID=A0A369VZZ3_9HYPH|nr:hydantoinase/oxoprolinase family protein [Pelagibacterium lacus]RDE07703.1 hydantoinase/oxoprolinase family protein [Pelagibacterium lacus]